MAETKTQFSKVADENRQLLKQLEDTQRENYQVSLSLGQRGSSYTASLEYRVCKLRACIRWLGTGLDPLQVTEHLRRELLAKTERIASLEAELVKVRL